MCIYIWDFFPKRTCKHLLRKYTYGKTRMEVAKHKEKREQKMQPSAGQAVEAMPW